MVEHLLQANFARNVANDLEVLGNELELFRDILPRSASARRRSRDTCMPGARTSVSRGNVAGSGFRTGGVRGDGAGAVSAAPSGRFAAKLVSSSSTISSNCTTRGSCPRTWCKRAGLSP